MESTLTGSHAKTFQRVTGHPMPHNVHWRDVCSMFSAMDDSEAVEDEHGNLKVTRGGQTLHLHRPGGKDLEDSNEITRLRHFLVESDIAPPVTAAIGTHLLVVIDHREARIYSTELHGSIPQRISPYDPFGFGRALHYNNDDANGQRKPERKSFYDAVIKTLGDAEAIVLFGNGTGASSAMKQLLEEINEHHRGLASRIVATCNVDEHHLTEDQLLAKAREVFASSEVV